MHHPFVEYGTQAQISNGMWGTQQVVTDYINAYISEYTISFAWTPYFIMATYFFILYFGLVVFAVVY